MMSNVMALKLDSSFRPIGVVEAVEALVMCLIGKARILESHEQEIRTVSKSFSLPAVIVLNRYVKFRFAYVACNRNNIFYRDNFTCQYCEKTQNSDNLTLDHVIPKSRGGKNTWENLVTACKKCNQRKGNLTPRESGMKLLKKPRQPKASILRTLKKEQISPQWKNYLWE
jgi:5-methylcytosine-specific restriction endonuclease McrA